MNEIATIHDPRREDLLSARMLRKVEITLAVALSLAWIIFHLRFFLHAGALWRDEINSVDLSNSPTIGDVWRNLDHDSFPMLWFLVLRFWIRTGLGTTDAGIRLLGLLVGLGILAVLWLNSRKFRLRPPIIALTLLGFSAAVICDAGSIRAYGLGPLLELLTFGLIWDVATRPTPLRVAAALLSALAAVHMLFYNSMILAAFCCGAIAVAALHRQWKRAGIIVAIGFISAASMTIYAPAIHRADAYRPMLVKEPGVSRLLGKFAQAVSYDATTDENSSAFNLAAWEIAALASVFVGAAALAAKQPDTDDSFRRDRIIYHLIVLCVGVLGYCWFLWRLSYLMQPWYYLALMVLIAVCADGLIGSLNSVPARAFTCAAVILFCCVTARPTWADASLRKTGVDGDARELAQISKKGDLIIVSPWYYAVTLQRYFHGPANYLTLPPMDFVGYQNYNLLLPAMNDPHAMDAPIARAIDVLNSGHTVFLLGKFHAPGKDQTYPTIKPPDANGKLAWDDADYYDIWERQFVYSLNQHSAQITRLPVDYDGVSDYERPTLFAAKLISPNH